jgi:outer membrane receptor for monomeric catechols
VNVASPPCVQIVGVLARVSLAVMMAGGAINTNGACAANGGRLHQGTAWSRSSSAFTWKQRLACHPYADPAAPYKADRLSSSRQRLINIPSQTNVVTRPVMDDKNATSIGEVLRTTPGVTVGR